MELFTEQAYNRQEALEKIYSKYGDRAKILNQRSIRLGGFLGMFSREGVEISGYLSKTPVVKRNNDIEEEKKKILSGIKNDKTIEQLLQEVQVIKKHLEEGGAGGGAGSYSHQTLQDIDKLLEKNEFSRSYINEIIKRLKNEASFEDLDDLDLIKEKVLAWIGESIQCCKNETGQKPCIFVLVGPTGVGKTTTIAKLAAMYGIVGENEKKVQVRILTIDNYRIGARQQIETYGEIMGIPVSNVESMSDMKKYCDLYHDVDYIFVDTIGKSPNDAVKLAEMKELLHSMGNGIEVHLAVSATTKQSDIQEIIHQFEPFKYRSIIITKLDETGRIGNLISALHEYRKPVSFITDGQRVPQDIEKAEKIRMLMTLEGFKVNREKIEENMV